MTEPTDLAGLMALVDQLVEHAREDDRMCYDQVSSQRFQDARDELQAAIAKWGTPPAVAGQHSKAVPLTPEQIESLLYKYGYDPDDEHMAEMLQAAVSLKRTPHAG